MKNLLKILTLVLLITPALFPQFRARLQGAAAIPTGYTEDIVSVGYGGSLNCSYLLNSYVEFSFTTGYYKFGYNENLPDYSFDFFTTPVLLGARVNLTDYDFIPYIGIEAGGYFSTYNLIIDYGYFGKEKVITKGRSWGISPELGFRINLTPFLDVDVNAKYNRINTKYITRAFVLIQSGFSYRF